MVLSTEVGCETSNQVDEVLSLAAVEDDCHNASGNHPAAANFKITRKCDGIGGV